MTWRDRILGPRVPREEMQQHAERYRIPTALFSLAALLLLVSIIRLIVVIVRSIGKDPA